MTVSGTIGESTDETPHGFFYVTDQYRTIEPRADVVLHPTADPHTYSYSFTIHLRAQRGFQTPNGRQYSILVGASDSSGTAGKTIGVLVPRHPVRFHQLPQRTGTNR